MSNPGAPRLRVPVSARAVSPALFGSDGPAPAPAGPTHSLPTSQTGSTVSLLPPGPRLLLISSKVKSPALVAAAAREDAVTIMIAHDTATAESIVAQIASTVAEKSQQGLMLFGTGQPGELLICNGLTASVPALSHPPPSPSPSSSSSPPAAATPLISLLARLATFLAPGARVEIAAPAVAGAGEGESLRAAMEEAMQVPVGLLGSLGSEADGVLASYFVTDRLRAWADPYTQFERVRPVGKGAFGTAVLYRRREDQSHVVLKEIDLHALNGSERQMALNESQVLSILSHENIITYYDSFEKDGLLVIEMEFADGGTLERHLADQRDPLPEAQVLSFFRQIASALDYIHEHSILHRDLKTANVFLMKEGTVKLGDFGISKLVTNTNKNALTVLGTPHYISPELCHGLAYDQKSDVWALGCIVHEMCCLRRTFDGTNLPALVNKICHGQFASITGPYSGDLKRLISSMLSIDPQHRPAAADLLADPLLAAVAAGTVAVRDEGGDVERGEADGGPVESSVYYFGPNDTMPQSLLFGTKFRITQVAVGASHALVLSDEQYVFGWGSNVHGQLGHGNTQPYDSPTMVNALAGKGVARIACGGDVSAFVSSTGLLLTCGRGEYGALGHGTLVDVTRPQIVSALLSHEVVSVGVGPAHMAVVTTERHVWVWGCADGGRLGLGKVTGIVPLPRRVELSQAIHPTEVCCGTDGTMLLTEEGRLLACGRNDENKLGLDGRLSLFFGNKPVEGSLVFKPLTERFASAVVDVSLGPDFTAVVLDSGACLTFGSSKRGVLARAARPRDGPKPLAGPGVGLRYMRTVCGEGFGMAAVGRVTARSSACSVSGWGRGLGERCGTGAVAEAGPVTLELFDVPASGPGPAIIDMAVHGMVVAIVVETPAARRETVTAAPRAPGPPPDAASLIPDRIAELPEENAAGRGDIRSAGPKPVPGRAKGENEVSDDSLGTPPTWVRRELELAALIADEHAMPLPRQNEAGVNVASMADVPVHPTLPALAAVTLTAPARPESPPRAVPPPRLPSHPLAVTATKALPSSVIEHRPVAAPDPALLPAPPVGLPRPPISAFAPPMTRSSLSADPGPAGSARGSVSSVGRPTRLSDASNPIVAAAAAAVQARGAAATSSNLTAEGVVGGQAAVSSAALPVSPSNISYQSAGAATADPQSTAPALSGGAAAAPHSTADPSARPSVSLDGLLHTASDSDGSPAFPTMPPFFSVSAAALALPPLASISAVPSPQPGKQSSVTSGQSLVRVASRKIVVIDDIPVPSPPALPHMPHRAPIGLGRGGSFRRPPRPIMQPRMHLLADFTMPPVLPPSQRAPGFPPASPGAALQARRASESEVRDGPEVSQLAALLLWKAEAEQRIGSLEGQLREAQENVRTLLNAQEEAWRAALEQMGRQLNEVQQDSASRRRVITPVKGVPTRPSSQACVIC
eukprot:m.14644 g.14644  ORF g.14644 m.14644 type:complete len:1439 (-) comp6476_c0_seq2:37-4353(-)